MEGLEELKHLYNSKQALNNIRFNYFESKRNEDANVEHFWFDTIEKELKALEIVKSKKVDVDYLDECIRTEVYPLSTYNHSSRLNLTNEEYDLLKEVML